MTDDQGEGQSNAGKGPGDQPTYSLPPAAQSRGPRGAALGAALIVALLLIGVIGYLVIRRDTDGPTTIESSASSPAATNEGAPAPEQPTSDQPGVASASGQAEGQNPNGQSTSGQGHGSGDATSGATAPGAAPSGSKAPAGETIDAFAVKDGDCLSDPGASSTVKSLTRIPCEQPHDAEVYAVYQFSEPKGAPYPGDDAVQNLADDGCQERLGPFLGISAEESSLDWRLLAPTQKTWADGDREVVCQVFDPNGTTTGTLRDAKR